MYIYIYISGHHLSIYNMYIHIEKHINMSYIWHVIFISEYVYIEHTHTHAHTHARIHVYIHIYIYTYIQRRQRCVCIFWRHCHNLFVKWLIHIWRHHWFIRLIRLMYDCGMTHWHLCVTRHFDMLEHFYVKEPCVYKDMCKCDRYVCAMCMWYDSFTRVTWIIRMSDMADNFQVVVVLPAPLLPATVTHTHNSAHKQAHTHSHIRTSLSHTHRHTHKHMYTIWLTYV